MSDQHLIDFNKPLDKDLIFRIFKMSSNDLCKISPRYCNTI